MRPTWGGEDRRPATPAPDRRAALDPDAPAGPAAGDAADAGDGGPPRRSRLPALVAFVVAASVGGAVRAWQVAGRPALTWNDTTDFLAVARAGWASPSLWAGVRAPGVPVVLKLLGGDGERYADAQVALAVVCWAALCASVATVVAGRWPRVLAVGVVLAFSITTPVTMWERSVLSESPGVSTLALVVAAGLQVARGLNWPRAAMLAAAAVPWLAVRDTHAVVALVGGATALAVVVAVALVRRWRSRGGADETIDEDTDDADVVPAGRSSGNRRVAALAAVVVGLGLLVLAGSTHGERQAFPTRNVYEVRVLPYPERVRWFAAHGMPQADVFLGPDARPPYREPGLPPVVYVADDDPDLGEWLDWVEGDGRAALARYAVTHPTYLVGEPFRAPERAFNNARGHREFYAALDQRRVPFVDAVLAHSTVAVLMAAAAAVGWAIGRGRLTPALATGAAVALLSIPHGLVAWHSDGMETARHLVVPALQLHLGVLLMLVGLLPAPRSGSGGPAAAGAVPSAHG